MAGEHADGVGMAATWQSSTEELLGALRDIEARVRREYAASLSLIAELQARDAAAELGYPSVAVLLRDVLRISPREAKRRLDQAQTVTETPLMSGGVVPAPLPAAGAAARDGVIGADHLDVIGRALTGLPLHLSPEVVAEAETTLVTAAASLDAHALSRVGARVRALLDQDGAPPREAELANPANELHLSTRPNGRTAFRGELEPEASALFRVLLSPLARPRPTAADGPDSRSPAERQGDAFAELLHLATGSADLPTEAGERPHLLVTMPLDALREGCGTADLNGVPSGLDATAARRLACDAKVIPAVLGSRSEPLDVGRASYTVPTALRRALVLRDGGCAFPGCNRPHTWCHAHHLQHWAQGGRTALDNLVLLCGHHHRLLHHTLWEGAVVNGVAHFTPPPYVDPTRAPRRALTYPLRR